MVEENVEQKKCSNCERMIDAPKLRMHEGQCARLNYKCKECGQVVSKEDKEQHEATEHVPVKCQFCSFSALKTQFGSHEDVCERRPKQCKFCEQISKFELFAEHQLMCGAKTKKCEVCARYICNRDWDSHVPKGECKKFQLENEAEKQRDIQKKMEEIDKFQREEEEKKKRDKIEKDRKAKELQAQ